MNQCGPATNLHHFNSSLSSSNLSNYISNYIYPPPPSDMDSFWRHNVPASMPEAFNIQTPNQLNQSSDALFRFTGLNPANPPTSTASAVNLNHSLPVNLVPQPAPALTHSNNWKTINNLHEASSLIGPYKRKCLLDDQDDLSSFQPPNKQNATEEKVIGRFNKLTIDEEFEGDSDEFILALDDRPVDEELDELGGSRDDLIEVETDEDLKCEKVQIELADGVQEFWNCDDVISKLVKEQKEKDSKALVLWRPPRVTFPSDSPAEDEEGEKKKTVEIVDCTSEYTVIEETSSDAIEPIETEPIETEPIESESVDCDPKVPGHLKLEISEWNEEDEDMMET